MSEYYVRRKRYGLFRFCWDFVLGVCTCGLWWLWLILKAVRNSGN